MLVSALAGAGCGCGCGAGCETGGGGGADAMGNPPGPNGGHHTRARGRRCCAGSASGRASIVIVGIHSTRQEWTIGVIYFIPNNPKLYVQLKNGITSMNVELLSVINIITNNVENYHYDNKV